MGYKYQMHTHTSPCSACGAISMAELVKELAESDYQGFVITNHFKHGNSGIDRNLTWRDFVRQYELDYLEGKKLAEKYGKDIIFSIEEGVGYGLEILCYGITPEILYNHPELDKWDVSEWYRVLSANNGLCIQAHPFRKRDYIPTPQLLPLQYIDGIEVYNSGNRPEENDRAFDIADAHSEFILTSGGDYHGVGHINVAGIESECRITNETELVTVLKSGNYKLLYAD